MSNFSLNFYHHDDDGLSSSSMVLPLRRWIALVSDCVCGAITGGLEGNFMVVKIHDGRKFHGGQDPCFGNLG